MDKRTFLTELALELSMLPEEDVRRTVAYYEELIDDRMEDGCPEAEAVAAMGSPAEVARQYLLELPLPALMQEKMKTRKRMGGIRILLILLGFPIWFPVLISIFAVVFSVYLTLWAVVLSFFAVVLALAVGAAGCVLAAVVLPFAGRFALMLTSLGTGFGLAGFTILFWFVSVWSAKGVLWLSKVTVRGLKKFLIRREAA